MNGTTLERPEVTAYLAALRAALADVPADERDELLADVETSLRESDGETMTRTPEAFAAELREAAGLQPSARATSRWDAAWRRVHAATTSEQVRALAPIWWVTRALVAAFAVSLLTVGAWPSEVVFSPTPFVLLALALVAGSIWVGFRSQTASAGLRRAVAAANAVLALAIVLVGPIALEVLRAQSVRYEPVAVSTPGLAVDGTPVANIYPYSRDGELLYDVLLYDEHGRPLNLVMAPDDTRRVLVDRFGNSVLNSFPIRYYEPGTMRVARPDLAPPVSLPRIETPALDAQASR